MRIFEITNIKIRGFKSIQSLIGFEPRAINVFIGQNGAGKSNFIGFFKFLSNMLSGIGNLQDYVGRNGGASIFLFDGPEITSQIMGYVGLKTLTGVNEYKFRLAHASADTFIYTEEKFRYTSNNGGLTQQWYDLGSGHKESALINSEATGKTQGTVKRMLQQLITYQFHSTTFSSPIRNNKSEIENNWYLEEDGRNLSSLLYELSQNQAAIYQKIVAVIQQIIPFFDDFVLIDQYGKTY